MGWFKKLSDVPGVSYSGPSDIERARLDGHDFVPEVHEYEFDGEVRRSLYWPSFEGGSTSASPVSQRAYDQEKMTPTASLRRLAETLELPGELSDYHFAIQNTYKTLFNERRQDFALLEEVEQLCWLDITLIEAHPSIPEYEPGEFFRVVGYELLMRLYEGEGYFAEALEIVERAARVGQEYSLDNAERLQRRLAELEAEDGLQEA